MTAVVVQWGSGACKQDSNAHEIAVGGVGERRVLVLGRACESSRAGMARSEYRGLGTTPWVVETRELRKVLG